MKRGILAILLILSAFFGVYGQSGPIDLILVLDTSSGMSSSYENVNNYMTGGFLREFLRIGDTFHLVPFSGSQRLDISRRIEGRGDVETIIGRMLLQYPLESSCDVSAALNYVESYVDTLPSRPKKIVLITGAERGAQFDAVKNRLSSRGITLDYIKVTNGQPLSNLPTSGRAASPAVTSAADSKPAASAQPPAAQATQTQPAQTQAPQPPAQQTATQSAQPATTTPPAQTSTAQAPAAKTTQTPPAVTAQPAAQQPPAQSQQPPATTQTTTQPSTTQTPSSQAQAPQTQTQQTAPQSVQTTTTTPPAQTAQPPAQTSTTQAPTVQPQAAGTAQSEGWKMPWWLWLIIGLIAAILLILLIIFLIRNRPYTSSSTKRTVAASSTADKEEDMPPFVDHSKDLANFAAAQSRYRSTPYQERPSRAMPSLDLLDPATPAMLNLFVEDQSTLIGKRNIHSCKSGYSFTIGGGRSDFLIFLVPMPPAIAEIRRDGSRLVFIPRKPKYFPDLGSKELSNCINQTIRVVSDKNYELRIRFEKYEDPLLELNRLLNSLKVPG